MNKSNKIIFIINIVLFICILTIPRLYVSDYPDYNVVCVPNEECAIDIAKNIFKSNYPNINYDEFTWKCLYIDENYSGDNWEADTWIVWCTKYTQMLDGSLAEIHIKRKNAEVVQFYYWPSNYNLE